MKRWSFAFTYHILFLGHDWLSNCDTLENSTQIICVIRCVLIWRPFLFWNHSLTYILLVIVNLLTEGFYLISIYTIRASKNIVFFSGFNHLIQHSSVGKAKVYRPLDQRFESGFGKLFFQSIILFICLPIHKIILCIGLLIHKIILCIGPFDACHPY